MIWTLLIVARTVSLAAAIATSPVPHAAIQNLEISCLKTHLAIPIDQTPVSGVGHVTTINCKEAVHAFRCGISNGCRVGVFVVADQAGALVCT